MIAFLAYKIGHIYVYVALTVECGNVMNTFLILEL